MAQTSFNFTGSVMIPKAESKRPLVRDVKGDGKMYSMNFGVKESDNNMAFVEMFGGMNATLRKKNMDGDNIEIKWEDRFDEDVVDSVPRYMKTIVNLGDDFGGSKEFLSQYDAVLFLQEQLPKFAEADGVVTVTGQMRKDAYNGQYYDKFIINNVYAAKPDTKKRLMLTSEIYYNKSCVDKSDWKSDKIIALDGYIQQYINKDEGTKYIPQRFVFNASKYDPENERHMNLMNYRMKYIDTSSKKYQVLRWDVVMINGTEAIEFDESQLTPAQKEQVALGIKTVDDFKPRGQIFGDRINEYRLLDPKLDGDYSSGLVTLDMTNDEFEDQIYVAPVEEKLEDVMKKAEITEDLPFNEDKEVDEDDLF